jgi:hypothetical protein
MPNGFPVLIPVGRHQVREVLAAAGTGCDRWGPNRLAGLSPYEIWLYLKVLRQFAGGLGSSSAASAVVAPRRYAGAVTALVRRDLLRCGPNGEILRVQPFSAIPTVHMVRLADGRVFYATCAIDAMGVAVLTGRDALIDSADPLSGTRVRIWVRSVGAPISLPTNVFVVTARHESPSRQPCETMNFVTSTYTAQRYCALLGTTSYLLSLAVASDAAKLIFGGLVDPDLMNQPAHARGGRRARRHLAAPGCLLPHAPAGSVGQRRRVALSASPVARKKEGVRT